jgi:cell division transport system ATP-binding protein
MIELEKVTRRFLGHRDGAVLDRVNLTVEPGQVVLVSGESGAGKSTLLELLYGAKLADSGAVRVFGHNVARLRRSSIAQLRRRIGVVPQGLQLLDDRTALENVALALEVRAMPRGEVRARAAEILGTFGLAYAVDAPVSLLSQGERQRVAISRALVSSPLLMVLDEPTAHLDPQSCDLLLQTLGELCATDACAVIATNNRRVISHGCLRGWTHYELADGVLGESDAYATPDLEDVPVVEETQEIAPEPYEVEIEYAPEEVANVVPFPVARAGGSE